MEQDRRISFNEEVAAQQEVWWGNHGASSWVAALGCADG